MKITKQNAKEYALIYDKSVPAYAEGAEDIVKYLNEVCSITLGDEITAKHFISIGVNEKSKAVIDAYGIENFKEDEFRILPKDGNLYIFGGCENACMYGCFELIERCLGVKWLNLDCTIVPKKEEMELPTEEIACKPYFNQRDFLMLQTSDYKGIHPKDKVRSLRNHHRFIAKKWCDMKWTDHNSFRYVSREKYKDEHPEFFCGSPVTNGWELCYSNGITDEGDFDESKEISVAKIAAQTLYEHIKEQQDVRFAMFGRQDDVSTVCQCERCVKSREKYGNEAGVMMVFLNAIVTKAKEMLRAEGLKADFGMATFAYQSTVNPPVINGTEPIHPKVVPNKDIYIRYAPIGADYTYPLLHEKQRKNVREQLIGWTSLTSNIMIWDYTGVYAEYAWYVPNMWYYKQNLELYANVGMEYVFNQDRYSANREWQGEMKAYIGSKLYWDMSLDVNTLKEEYIRGYYGLAADKVLKFIDNMDEFFAGNAEKGISVVIVGVYGSFYDPESYDKDFLLEQIALLDSAIADVENSGLAEEEKAQLIWRLKHVLITPLRMLARGESYYFPKGGTAYNKRFYQLAEEVGMTDLGEHTPMYCAMTKDGQPLHRIVINKEAPTKEAVEAANYLQQCLKEKTGLTYPIIGDDVVFPAFGEKGICVGGGMMYPEFFKGKVDITKYEYHVELCGSCAFIHGAGDLTTGVDAFMEMVSVSEENGVKTVKLPHFRMRKEK